MKLWILHPQTKKADPMLTLAVMSTVVVLLKFIFSGVEVAGVKIGPLDAGVVASLLTPTIGAYAIRRHTDKEPTKPSEDQ